MLPAAPAPLRPLFFGRGRQGAERLSACCSAATPLPANDAGQRVSSSLTQSPHGPRPPLTLPTHSSRTQRSLCEHLQQTNAARRSRHNAPSSPAPLTARPRPLTPRTAGTRSFGPKRPHSETTLASEGRAELGPPSSKSNLYASRDSLCHF